MASGKIKGITVEIGGDTTKLGKAIADNEKQTRSLQVELRQVEKLLKFDPTNTELLTQKQNILADAIAETSSKLDTMREAEAQVIAQFERGDIGEDQLRAFQREIIQTENSLGELKTELQTATRNLEEFGDNNGVAKEETAQLERAIQAQNDALEAEKNALKQAEQAQKEHEQAVNDAKQTLSDFGDRAKGAFDTAKTGATVLGGAVVATTGYAVKLSTEFDQAFNLLIARTGASSDEFDSLNTAMENVYKNNFGESIEDVAQSMATVQVNTKLSGEELQSVTQYALLLRDTFEFDVNESTRTAKMLMDQFGISGEQAYNLIAQGAQSGLDKNGDLLDTINEYAVHFEQLGISADEMFNMLVNGAESGTFSVDKLGDAVKEFGIRVKDGTANNAFKELGLDVDATAEKFARGGEGAKQALQDVTTALFEMDDPLKQNQLGVELFGTMWEDLGVDGVKALMNLEGEVSKSKDALNEINQLKYDDIGSALQGLGRTIETDVVLPLGEQLQPVVEETIGYVQDNAPQITAVLSTIATAIADMVNFLINNAPTILAIVAGIGAGLLTWNVVSIITGVVEAIKAFKLANEGATIAQTMFNAVLKANPIGLLVTVIAGVVTALITFIATNEDARAKVVAVWNTIKTTVTTVVNAVKTSVTTVWNGIKNTITNVSNAIKSTTTTVWNAIKTTITTVVNNVNSIITNVFNAIKSTTTNVWNAIKNVITSVFNSIKNTVSSVSNSIKSIITNSWNTIKSGVSSAVNSVQSVVSSAWNAIKSTTSTVWNSIKSLITNPIESAKSIFTSAIDTMRNALDFNWSLPHINLPHFEVWGGEAPYGIGGKGSLPSFSVEWYKNGGIFDKPTIIPTLAGLKGIGEAGPEAVAPISDLMYYVQTAVNTSNQGVDERLGRIESMIESYLPAIATKRNQIVLDSGVLVGETINQIDEKLANTYAMKARGI